MSRAAGSTPLLTLVRSTFAILLVAAFALLAGFVSEAEAQPVATTTVTPPASPLIGQALSFPVTFDNTGTITGYGPFIDLVLPATGADGAGAAIDDGVTFVSATYLGQPVTAVTLTFNASGQATHPYAVTAAGAPVVVTGTPGDQLVVLRLPFGSFTPTQPAATIQITANLSNLADLGVALPIRVRGGFQFGADPLSNPATDPSIVGTFPAVGVAPTVTPAVWTLSKTYVGPEDETTTGPNFPRQYRLDVDVATGQTVTTLAISDLLPGNLQFVAVVGTLVNGVPAVATAVATPSTTTPGGTLTRQFASVTGTAGAQDVSLIFSYFVPRVDSGNGPVINPGTGDDATAVDDASASGAWTPIDARDSASILTNNATANDHTLAVKSLAIQKSVTIAIDTGAAGPTPGDTLQYTLQAQVSDFFALQGLVLSDVMSDGQRRDPGFVPTLAIAEHSGGTSAGNMNLANFSFVVSGTTGETAATFLVAAEQVSRGLDASLLGGCVPAGGTGGPPPNCTTFNGGATTVTVVYRAVILDEFTNTFPSGDPSVDHGDVLGNTVTAVADLLSTADVMTPTGSAEDDASGSGVTIPTGTLTKTIYAINGNPSFPLPPSLGPGDTVTYRIRYTLPSSDLEPLTITDYLPLPVLLSSEIAGPFVPTVSAVPPPAGGAQFGPADTFFGLSGLLPAITSDVAGNSLRFAYTSFDDPLNRPSTIDILFTVTATNTPFADGLFLTNQVRVEEGTTNAGQVIIDGIVQIILNEPDLRIRKGAVTSDDAADVYAPVTVGPVAFNAPGTAGNRFAGTISSNGLAATPINSNVSALDAGDIVTFAITVENLGNGPEGAFDVVIRDTLPANLVVPAGGLNLRVTNGAGTALPFTDLGGGLFGGGIQLNDPGVSQGAIAAYNATSGANIAVLTFDLQLAAAVPASSVLTNTATLANYAGTEGGPDFTTVDLTDPATVTVPGSVVISKAAVGTNQAHTSGSNVAIGEQITYRVTVRVPQGVTPSATLVDTLDSGLAVVSLDTITASAGLTAANGSFAAILAAATIGPVGAGTVNAGRQITFSFGAITNADTDNATAETIVLTYTVVVLNSPGNNRGVGRNNAAALTYTGGSSTLGAANVVIVEPTLQVVKTATPTSGDANDPITFTVTLAHAGGSNTTAFDVTLSDVLPAGFTFVSATNTGGLPPTTFTAAGGFLATWTSVPVGNTSTFQIVATVNSGLPSGAVLTNSATTTYTSLPGAVTTAQSTFNTLSTERTGNPANPGGAENDYTFTGSAGVTVSAAAVTKAVVDTNQPHTAGNNVAVGEILTYTVTVTVPEAISNGVTLVDTLDPGLAFVGFDTLAVSNPGAVTTSVGGGFPAVLAAATVSNPTPGNPETAGSRVTFNFGTVTNTDVNGTVAETITLTYRAVVLNTASNVRGQLRNNSVSWTAGSAPVTASAPNVTLVEPTLQVVKTATPTGADAGDSVTFTMVISHVAASNTDAFNAALADAIPAGLTVTSGPTATGVAPTTLALTAGVINATWTAFPLGSTTTITFTATLDTALLPGTVVTNTAAATWTGLPGTVGTPLSTYNPLSVERTGNPADPGGAANTYAASDPAAVTINSNSLAGRVYVDATGDGVYTPGEPPIGGVTITLTGTDHLGNPVTLTTTTLADGTYAFTLLRPGTYTVREAQPLAYADGLDSAGSAGGTVGNDVTTGILLPTGVQTNAIGYNFGERPTADLEVTKTDAPDPVVPGSPLVYTMLVRNNGPSAAANVVFRDPIPTGTAFASLTSPGLSCTSPPVGSTGDVVCTVASLASGASATVTLTVLVSPTLLSGAVITNAAAVGSDTVDPRPDNNRDAEPTVVAGPGTADLSITKTDAADPVTTGSNVTYALTIRNNGPANGTNVVVTDTLPAGVTLVSATPSQGAGCTGTTTVSCDLGALANGAQATVVVVVTTSVPGVITNQATVTATEPDPAPGNNVATEPTTVGNPTDADLVVTKVDAVDPVLADGVIGYRITVENRGPGAAAGVVVADTVPVSTTFESLVAPAGWTCTTPAPGGTGAISCSTAAMAVGATATFDIGVRVLPGTPAGTTVTNTVTVGAATPDPNPVNNTDTEPTLVVGAGAADLAIIKTDAPDPQAAGAPVSYTLTITNNGPSTATGVTITDPLPAGTTLLAASPGCTETAGVLTCAIGTLAPGASTAVGVTISTPPVAGTINNVATVAANEPDPVPGNNTEPETTVLVAVADVRIAKNGPASATPGSTVSYTLVITNDGPSQADNVTVVDPTPLGLVFVSTSGACTTAFPCLLGTLPPAAVRTINVVFQVPSGYTAPNPIVNIATVSTTTGGDNPANNAALALTPLTFSGDVEVLKTASTLSPGVGANFDYVITVRNLGPSDVTNTVVTEFLPAGVTYQSHVTSSGTYVPATALWTIPALAAGGGSATLTLTVRADVAGPLPNTARRTGGDQPDNNPANDEATVTPVAVNQTDVAILKTGPARVLSGATFAYTLTVRNNGPALAAAVVVTDPTPANLTFVSNSGACTTAFPCALGDLLPGEERVITTTFTVGIVPDGTLVQNTATVTSTTPDTNPANNVSTVDTTVDTRVDVGVAKSVVPAQARIGAPVTFTITAGNNGPNPATGVIVTDLLPFGLAFQSATPSAGTYDAATGRWAIGNLAVGQSVTLSVVATVQVAGPITNVVVRTFQNEPDADPSNDSAAATVNSGPYADIGVLKSAVPTAPVVGAPLTYTIVVRNFGPDTAPAVTVDDVLPPAVTFVSATPSVGTFNPATGRWTIGTMLNGASASLTLATTVAQAGPFINSARVTGVGIFDPNPVNDQDAVVLNAITEVNLRVAKAALRPTVGIFEDAPFLVTITNDGPSPATGVEVTDSLPNGLVFVSAQASQGTYAPATGIWAVGSLASSQTATLQIVARVVTPGPIVNVATMSHVDQPDLNPADNTASAPVSTPATTGGACSDVALRQVFAPFTTPGGLVPQRYTAVNFGPAYAMDLEISGMIPPGVTVESMTASSGGSCMVMDDMVVCHWLGATLIGEGAARVADVVFRVSPTAPAGSTVWGWFMTHVSNGDCNHANDMVDNYVYVDDGSSRADLQVRSAVMRPEGPLSEASVPVGEPFVVRLAVTNHGPAVGSGDYALTLSEAGALVVESATATSGVINGSAPNQADWLTGPVAPGTTIYADFRVRMTRATAIRLTAVRLRGGPADPDATNDISELVIDGVGPAPGGGRWVATGNIDGAAGEEIVTGTAEGDRPQVRVFRGDGVDTGLRFYAFEPSFLGGVRVASCDIDADGIDEVIVGQGPGGSAVRVMRIVAGTAVEVTGFQPFEPAFAGGVFLSCADLDGDSRDDVVVGAGPGRAADVRVFTVSSAGVGGVASWQAYPAPFAGGVRVATGAHAGSGFVGAFQVLTTPGPGIPVVARAWSVGGGTASLVAGGAVYPVSYAGGATAALGDIDGDGTLELAVAPDNAEQGLLRVFSLTTGQPVLEAPAGSAGFVGGLRVDIGTLAGGPGRPEIVVTGGAGELPVVQVYVITPSGAVRRVDLRATEIP